VFAKEGLRMTPFHPTCYQLLDEELSSLLEVVLAGEAIGDWAIAERLVRFLGAAISLHERHIFDRYGRCVSAAPAALVLGVFGTHVLSHPAIRILPARSLGSCRRNLPR
jgi:hypothetical protein